MVIDFCFSLGATQIQLDQQKGSVPPDRILFAEFLRVGTFFPQNCVSEVLLRVAFPTAVLPMGDHIGFALGDPLFLQSRPIVSAFDWVVVLSTLVVARFLLWQVQ